MRSWVLSLSSSGGGVVFLDFLDNLGKKFIERIIVSGEAKIRSG
jgi:hypothetical protein